MTVTLTATPVAPPATTAVPAPGESVNSAGVQAYVQSIINSIDYVSKRLPGANPATDLLGLSVSLVGAYSPGGQWAPAFSGAYAFWTNSTAGLVYVPLPTLLDGTYIHHFEVLYSGSASYGALPAVMPVVSLVKLPGGVGAPPSSLGAPTVIDSQADTSASAAAFKNIHIVGKTLGTPERYDSTLDYYLRIASESGAGYLTGSAVWSNGTITVAAA